MSATDFDLHGLVGIRLLDATPAEADAVERQVGPIRRALAREPDLTIRWVDRIEAASPLRVLGDYDAAYSNDAFFLLRGKHKSRLRVQIPFDAVGGRCQIVCEHGAAAVPLLVPIIHLTMLAKGIVPIHASAFVYQGRGVLAAGWSKGGKTEALLSFLARGAQYVADDWVYISPDGRWLYGIPEPLQLRGWHLDDLPSFRGRIEWRDRLRLWPLDLADRWKDSRLVQSPLIPRLLGRWLHFLGRQAAIKVPPAKLFGSELTPQPAPLDHLFLLGSHDSPEIVVEPVDAAEVARRMVFSVQQERSSLLSYYCKFRFAFPDRPNALLEQSEELQRELLTRVLADKPALAVWHPYPVKIPRLFECMEPLIGRSAPTIASSLLDGVTQAVCHPATPSTAAALGS
jgi:hypothetical protein